ncbi:CDP-diacylglycerol--serine O-phosphatidyltransferase [Kaistia sp. 32K]|nr:CDP-diacylglycerol--serine O-phosphatidyltransferase [Kaistia sp. 32K]
MILPNLVTLLALCAGLTAIRMAIEARYGEAIAMIVVAAVLDGIDGRVARLLRSTSRFGAELDSLTDFVNFGVAPAILLYVWALDEVRSLGWIAALVFAICAALRLARFNVAIDNPHKPDWQANFFVGVPAPAGALIVLLPVYLEYLDLPHGRFTAPVVLVYTLAVGLLMVSRLPTWSGKKFGARVSREIVLPLFVVVVVLAASLLSYPWHVLAAGALVYLAALPIGWRAWQKHVREDAAKAVPASDGNN